MARSARCRETSLFRSHRAALGELFRISWFCLVSGQTWRPTCSRLGNSCRDLDSMLDIVALRTSALVGMSLFAQRFQLRHMT